MSGRGRRTARGLAPAVAGLIALSAPLVAGATASQGAGGAAVCQGRTVTIAGTTADDQLNGTSKDDVIDGGAGNDRIDGRGGNDVLCGGAGDDQLLAGSGRGNVLAGGDGNDALTGGSGIDILDGGPGDDVLTGGAGRDAASFENAPAAIRVDLARGQATGWGTDRLSGIESALGSRFADVLRGDGQRNRLSGLLGNDQLKGAGGSDLLDGGPGVDSADGGPGPDLCVAAERKASCP